MINSFLYAQKRIDLPVVVAVVPRASVRGGCCFRGRDGGVMLSVLLVVLGASLWRGGVMLL